MRLRTSGVGGWTSWSCCGGVDIRSPSTLIRTRMHLPYSAEEADDIRGVSGVAAPGETLALGFSLAADADAGELGLEATELRGEQGSIPAAAVDLHVVRVWQQAGVGVYQDAPVLVPELLLKDDRVALRDRYTRRRPGSWRPYRRRVGYVAPDVRLCGEARTQITAGVAKQVFVTVRVPADATPGHYRG